MLPHGLCRICISGSWRVFSALGFANDTGEVMVVGSGVSG